MESPITAGTFSITAGGSLRGELRVPGDKSVSHRALMLAALAEGTSEITGLSDGADVAATGRAVAAFGADVLVEAGAGAKLSEGTVTVHGGALRAPSEPIDVGNSGTAIRLLSGIAAGCPFTTVIGGDESVNRRPMDRVAVPLRRMGATIEGVDGGRTAPLHITGGNISGIHFEPPVASAQVKSAVLLAGLFASGETTVSEAVRTRAHTEEMLAEYGADISVVGNDVTVRASRPSPFRCAVPGDPSAAAFWMVAAAIVGGSDLTVHDVYVGPGRDGFLRVLERMGARLSIVLTGPGRARLHCRHGALRGTVVTAAELPDLIDEVPILAVAAALADGTTRFEGADELRHKESDRLASVLGGLSALGAAAEIDGDTLVVHGGRPLHGGTVDALADHRIAMAFCIGGLAAPAGEETTLSGWNAVTTSYPGFGEHLAQCLTPGAG